MEAANLPTFLKFANAKKSDICVIFAKNYGSPRSWGVGLEQNWGGLCTPVVPPGQDLKQPINPLSVFYTAVWGIISRPNPLRRLTLLVH